MQPVNLEYARRPDGSLHVALGGDWKLSRVVERNKASSTQAAGL